VCPLGLFSGFGVEEVCVLSILSIRATSGLGAAPRRLPVGPEWRRVLARWWRVLVEMHDEAAGHEVHHGVRDHRYPQRPREHIQAAEEELSLPRFRGQFSYAATVVA
jgi:hypothetical protein